MSGPYVTQAQMQQALDALEQRQGVLIRQLQGGELLDGGAWTGGGATWSGAVPTGGVPFVTKRAGTFLLSCEASAYQGGAAGTPVQIDVWVDGVKVGSMTAQPAVPTGVRMVLPRLSVNIALAAGAHWVAFQLVSGNSGNDQGSVELTRIG